MITQWFMGFLHGVAAGLSSWMHGFVPAPPNFIAQLTAGFNTAYAMVPDALKYFLPLAPLVVAGVALVGLMVVLGFIRLARRVLSLFTGGGGAG